MMCLDFTAWDWGVKQEMLDADAQIRAELCDHQDCDLFLKRAWTIGNSEFVLENGEVWIQRWSGMMKSGWNCTSPTNSRISDLVSLREMLDLADGEVTVAA